MRRLVLLLVLSAAGPASAQLPLARLDRLTPLGGKAGSSVVLELTGRDLDGAALRFDRPGFSAEAIKANQFRVLVPADAEQGTVEVRAVGRHGVSAARLFAVQRGLDEVAEKEPNDSPDKAQPVPLDCAVNGTSDNDGDDHFRFAARKGQRVVLDCLALRLDSTLRAAMELSDAEGKVVARSRPYHLRTDPMLDVEIPADGDYVVKVHDTTFRGGLPYRLVVTTRPQVEAVFPLAAEVGKRATLSVLGRNLPRGKPFSGQRVLDLALDALDVAFDAGEGSPSRFPFLEHPAAPAAALRGVQVRPKGVETVNAATLMLCEEPVTAEKEPNDSAEAAQPLTLPAAAAGRFDRPGDADWYSFAAKAGEAVRVELYCERLGQPGDPFVLVNDDKGREVAQFDDHGINFNALSLYNRDPSGTFTPPVTGTYRLLVQERYRQGGPRYGYVLRVARARPDFDPVVFHATNPDPTSPLVRAGGSAYVEVCLNRRDYAGPVTVEAKGLPPGVTCPPVRISPQTQTGAVVFTAAEGAKEWTGAVRLEATALIDGKALAREVRPVQRRWAIDNVNLSRLCRELCLAVRPGAPYGLRCQEKATAAQGGSCEVTLSVRRHGEFAGKVQVTGLGLPPGFGFAATEVPEGKAEATAKLTVAANVPPGTYTVNLRGDAQVPYAKDGKAKANVRVADPASPVLVEVTPKK